MSKIVDRAACAGAVEACACFNFAKASRSVTQLFNSTLQPSGLRSTQFVLLAVVYVEEPASMSRLVQRMVVDRSTLTRNLKPLEAAGFVKVTQPASQRAKSVRLTAKGRRKLTATVPLWERAQELFVERLGIGKWKGLQKALSSAVTANRAV